MNELNRCDYKILELIWKREIEGIDIDIQLQLLLGKQPLDYAEILSKLHILGLIEPKKLDSIYILTFTGHVALAAYQEGGDYHRG
jgi:hypothetical protein